MKSKTYRRKKNGKTKKGKEVKVLIPEVIIPDGSGTYDDGQSFGRPSKYLKDPDGYNALMLLSMAEGMTKEAACTKLGIRPMCLWRWERKGTKYITMENGNKILNENFDPAYETLTKTIQEGQIYRQIWWEEMGRINLHNKAFNYIGWLMQMCNLFRKRLDVIRNEGWSRQVVEANVNVQGSIAHGHVHAQIDMKKLDRKEVEKLEYFVKKAESKIKEHTDI